MKKFFQFAIVAVAAVLAAHCKQEVKGSDARGMAAGGLERGVLQHGNGRFPQVYAFPVFPWHRLGDEGGRVYAFFEKGRVHSAVLQGAAGVVVIVPQDGEHYMVGGDIVPACADSLVAAELEDLEKFFGKA